MRTTGWTRAEVTARVPATGFGGISHILLLYTGGGGAIISAGTISAAL